MAITINAQFNKFVQFAQQQPNAATSTAIARVTGNEDPLAGRSISASTTDHVRGVFSWGAFGHRCDKEQRGPQALPRCCRRHVRRRAEHPRVRQDRHAAEGLRHRGESFGQAAHRAPHHGRQGGGGPDHRGARRVQQRYRRQTLPLQFQRAPAGVSGRTRRDSGPSPQRLRRGGGADAERHF